MRYISYIIITLLIIASACSPKVSDSAASAESQAKEMMEKEQMAKDDMASMDKNAFRKTVPAAGPAPQINIGEAESFELPNGLKVIVVENHKVPQVSFQLSLINDPIREGDKVGKVAMAGDILARGTTTRTKAEIDAAVDYLGANLSSSSGGIFASALTKHQDKLLDIMSDVLYNPSFPEDELDKIKKQVLSGLESAKTDPNGIANNIRAKVLYGEDHPYGEIQIPDHVNNITLADLKAYYNDYFVPSNAYLIMVGDITKDQAMDVAKKYFANWKGSMPKKPARRPVAMSDSRNVNFAHKDGAVQSVIIVANPVDIKPGDVDAIPARVMNTILGGGFSGRLNLNLREDKAYTYGAGSSISTDPLIGSFSATASTRSEVTDSSIVQFLYELERIRTDLVDEEDLQNIKNYMTGGFARSLESPQTIARFAYNIARYNLPADYYQVYLKKLNAVTREDILSMAKKYIHPDKADIIVVGNRDDVADKLSVFDADGEIAHYDAFANEIKINDVPLPTDITAAQIVGDYINAIGGEAKLASIKSLYTKSAANMMGQDITIDLYQMDDSKLAMKMGSGAMVFMEQKYDGMKGSVSQMGQAQVFTEGDELQSMKESARVIPQRYYVKEGATLELKGIEDVDGEKAYRIVVTDANGKASSEYYNVASGLLIRSLETQEGPQGAVTITTDVGDYKDVGNGIMLPHVLSVVGMLPGGAAMKMTVSEIQVNGSVDEAIFNVE